MVSNYEVELLAKVEVCIAPDFYKELLSLDKLYKLRKCLTFNTAGYFLPTRKYPAEDCISVEIYSLQVQSAGPDMLVEISLYTTRKGDPKLDKVQLQHVATAVKQELREVKRGRRLSFEVNYVEAVMLEVTT